MLPDDAELVAEQRDGLLGGVTAITAESAIAVEPAWGESPETRPLRLTAVPYFAWANRGDGTMDIWLARSIGHATPLPAKTAADEAEITSSSKDPAKALAAIRDGRSGPASDHRPTPRFAWPDTADGTGWLEYRWPEPRELGRAAVYWAVDRRAQVYWGPRIRGLDLALPESWRISYYDGSNWRPVETGDPYTLRLDLPNEVRFKPVTTTALRLEVGFATTPCAVQEWRVSPHHR